MTEELPLPRLRITLIAEVPGEPDSSTTQPLR
jgi:hypothetical protein